MKMELYIILTVVVLIVYYVLQRVLLKPRRNTSHYPPYYPGRLPIIGHALLLFGSFIRVWNTMDKVVNTTKKNGDVLRFQWGPTWNMSIVTDPEDCFHVGKTCLEKDHVYKLVQNLLYNGLVTSPVHIWKRHRKILSPAFNQQVIDGYMDAFNNNSRTMVKKLEAEIGKPFDQFLYLERCTLAIIFRTTMGLDDADELLNNEFLHAVQDIFKTMVYKLQNIWMLNNFLYSWTSLKKKEDELTRIMHDITYKAIQKKRQTMANKEIFSSCKFKSFMDILIQDADLTDVEIRDEALTMIVAGYDTQATTLTYVLTLIASNPNVQNKIVEELEMVFEGSDRDVTKEDFPKLIYLEAVIKESMRLYPVVPMVSRYVEHDVPLKNYTLPGGTYCIMSLYGVSRNKVWGPDADKFRPERWLEGDVPVQAFAAFSLGKRNCIGQKFAMMCMSTIICHILRKYRLHGDCSEMVLEWAAILKPVSGHHISIEKRNNNILSNNNITE